MNADLRHELDSCINDLRAAANLLTEAAARMEEAVQGAGELNITGQMRHYSDRYAAAAKRLDRVR